MNIDNPHSNKRFGGISEHEIEEMDDVIEDDGSDNFDEVAEKTYADAKQKLKALSKNHPRDVASASSAMSAKPGRPISAKSTASIKSQTIMQNMLAQYQSWNP